MAALASVPVIPAYSISKAAAFSMTQSLRALLAGQGVTVHAVFLGPIDTDMSRGFEAPKASPESAALAIFDGWRKRKMISSPIPCPSPWPKAGALARPRRSSASMRFSCHESVSNLG
jgi:NAD(P)-dependent dehydrogenase (short-subunit alcohol dehydrogenase family)